MITDPVGKSNSIWTVRHADSEFKIPKVAFRKPFNRMGNPRYGKDIIDSGEQIPWIHVPWYHCPYGEGICGATDFPRRKGEFNN